MSEQFLDECSPAGSNQIPLRTGICIFLSDAYAAQTGKRLSLHMGLSPTLFLSGAIKPGTYDGFIESILSKQKVDLFQNGLIKITNIIANGFIMETCLPTQSR